MSEPSIFQHESYREFLAEHFAQKGQRGQKARTAQSMGVHPAYLSRVMNAQADLNLEQADRLAAFLQFTEEETRFFFLLVQGERAGTASLQKHFRGERARIRQQRENLHQRLPAHAISPESVQALYYSRWLHAAVHVLVSIPSLRTRQALSRRLGVPPAVIQESLDFLTSAGFVEQVGGFYRMGITFLHLPEHSPFVVGHHAQWRLKGMETLAQPGPKDLRFSSVVTLSAKDVDALREQLVSQLRKNAEFVKESPAEEVYIWNLDFVALTPSAGEK